MVTIESAVMPDVMKPPTQEAIGTAVTTMLGKMSADARTGGYYQVISALRLLLLMEEIVCGVNIKHQTVREYYL